MIHLSPKEQDFVFPPLPRLVCLGFLLSGVLAVYLTTVQSLLARWNQTGSEYGHGLLLIGVIVWLIVRERRRLLQAEIKPCYWALVPAILCSLLWSAGYITQVNIVQQVALPCVIFFSVTALMGIAVARIIWFPLSLIVFALPLWNVLQPLLQDLAAFACARAFSVIDIPVHINGNFITVTSGTFQIAAGCSGLNLFLAAAVLGILYAHLNLSARRDKLIVVLLALLLGIICNWVRIITIILVAQLSDDIRHPIVQDHGWLGWAWFTVLFATYLFFVNKLPFVTKSELASAAAAQARATQRSRICVSSLIICMLGVYSAPLFSMYLLNRSDTDPAPLVAPPDLLGKPTYLINDPNAWRPDYHGATSKLNLRFVENKKSVNFHLYYYANQLRGAEMIHFDNRVVNEKRWRILRVLNQHSDLLAPWWKDIIVESKAGAGRKPLLVRYWYSVAGTNTASKAQAKLLQLKGFLQNRTDASLVAISATCAQLACESAKKILDKVAGSVALETEKLISPPITAHRARLFPLKKKSPG